MYLATRVHRIYFVVYVRQYYAYMQVYFGCRSDSLNQKLMESSQEAQKLQLELADRERENEQLRSQLLSASRQDLNASIAVPTRQVADDQLSIGPEETDSSSNKLAGTSLLRNKCTCSTIVQCV